MALRNHEVLGSKPGLPMQSSQCACGTWDPLSGTWPTRPEGSVLRQGSAELLEPVALRTTSITWVILGVSCGSRVLTQFQCI